VSRESNADQEALENYPTHDKDLLYNWAKQGTRNAIGLPLNVQVVGLPWREELVVRVMKELEENVSFK